MCSWPLHFIFGCPGRLWHNSVVCITLPSLVSCLSLFCWCVVAASFGKLQFCLLFVKHLNFFILFVIRKNLCMLKLLASGGGSLSLHFIRWQSNPEAIVEFMKRKSNDTVKFVERLFVVFPVCIRCFSTPFGRWTIKTSFERTPLEKRSGMLPFELSFLVSACVENGWILIVILWVIKFMLCTLKLNTSGIL